MNTVTAPGVTAARVFLLGPRLQVTQLSGHRWLDSVVWVCLVVKCSWMMETEQGKSYSS